MPIRTLLATTALTALALTGCATASTPADGSIHVVATTSVYGQIVEQVGGEYVTVQSIVNSAAQDPHSYEPSSRDKLVVSQAALVVSNGGGYDAFINGLLPEQSVALIEAVVHAPDFPDAGEHGEGDHHDDHDEHDHEGHDHEGHDHDDNEGHDHAGHDHIGGFNEHVWYDPEIMAHLATHIAHELSELAPDHAAYFTSRAEEFAAEIAELESDIHRLSSTYDGVAILVTEPVALRLTDHIGLHNLTPTAFTEAVEEGQDVAPATLLATLKLIQNNDVRVVIANTQTGGVETQRVIDDATAAAIPVLEFAEILPDSKTYVQWMYDNISELETALENAA